MPTRRAFVLAGAAALLLPRRLLALEAPRDDPAAAYGLAWTERLPWERVVDVTATEGSGKYWDRRLAEAQRMLAGRGGGVVYFPAGVYHFEDHIRLLDGVLLRGASPTAGTSARDAEYRLATRFEFPQYVPTFAEAGTPIDTAFKGIYLDDPAGASRCGVIHVEMNRGHIHLGEGDEHRCGRHRLVLGCVLRNAAVADPRIPNLEVGQHRWQRFTARHHAAIDIKAAENLLVANNRLPKSGDDNFVMREYRLKPRGEQARYDVEFDYDNRPGLYANHFCIGGAGGSGEDGSPETHPWGFRKGIVIRDNYIFNTGRMGIGFSGDGVICAGNVIRFEKDVLRPTTTGDAITTGSSTNDNRAIEMRGWRWVVERNDYEVYRNWCADRRYLINDGEGLMHEDHCNSEVRDSRLSENRGNSYISIYKCGPIDGLVIAGNDISTLGSIADIYVVANRNSGSQPCRRVDIAENTTRSNGIFIAGDPASENRVRANRHIGGEGVIRNAARADVSNNRGYRVQQ